MKRFFFAAAALLSLGLPAQASLTLTFDNAGDVVTSPTQAPGVWYTDRYAPAGFASGQSGGSRTGVLQHDISAADADGSRPSGFNSAFYNTQGRKYDLPAASTTLEVELYIPQSWDSLNQATSGSGRLASLWATGFDALNAVSSFPIIEFNNNRDGLSGNGFRGWNGASFFDVGGFAGFDRWYTLGITLSGGSAIYTIDGNVVGSFATPTTTSLGNVILQGYNAGTSYTIFWDNLEAGGATAVPEPATIGSLALAGVFGLALRARRRR